MYNGIIRNNGGERSETAETEKTGTDGQHPAGGADCTGRIGNGYYTVYRLLGGGV